MARGANRRRDGHSSGTPVARRIKQPTRMTGPDGPETCVSRHSYSVLLPVGFAVPLPSPEARCALTAPFHPYRGYTQRAEAVSSLWHFPWGVTPAGCYPAPFVHGARTFLPGHLSSLARSGRPA